VIGQSESEMADGGGQDRVAPDSGPPGAMARKKGRSAVQQSALADLSNYKLDGSIKNLGS
jgi:hypothetical protein